MKRSKIEEEKRNKYNANDLFKSKIEINQNNKNDKKIKEKMKIRMDYYG